MSRLHIVSLLLLLFVNLGSINAQDSKKSWKKLVKDAEELEKLGDLFRSAQSYEEAYNIKKDKKEFAYKAGKNYMETRHYAKAVKCLEPVKDDNNNPAYEKPGYTYACALKQSGQFAEARIEFEKFITAYEGSDKEKMREMAEAEIQGCTYALKGTEITNPNVTVQLLDFNVNTDRTEFAPIPFADNVLYFSSTVSGVSKIYRTQKNKQGAWMTRQVPTIFTGKMSKPHFGNGSFTPDGKRFFFTQCDLIVGGKPMCEIYLMYEEKGNWSTPQKLPDHINLTGFNTTHPFITIVEDKEVLYFASDREGGVGGMDLWYATRNLSDGDNTAFTLPKNLGRNINTVGDEVSPHYHYPSRMLYFSSNGKVSAGGFDVYKSLGEKMDWEPADNIGFPLNSAADDLFFVVSDAHGGGYFISNRLFGKDKQSTTNDDLFYYSEIKKQLLVKGAVYDEKDPTKTPLKDVTIKFYEMDGNKRTLAHDRFFALANEYKVILAADKEYKMEVICDRFEVYSADISTKGVKSTETRVKDIALKKGEGPITIVSSTVNIIPETATKENPYTLPETSPYVEGTPEDKAYQKAKEVAKEGDGNKVYWEGNELKAYKEPVVVVVDTKEARFVVVPEEYNSDKNPFTLPKTVPVDEKTGKPYSADSDVYKAYTEANKVALQADDRKVYWENGSLKAYKEPELAFDKFVIVPEEFNSKNNPYTLPTKVPNDPRTGKPYAAGSAYVKAFLAADSVAKKADARKVYWDNDVLTAVEKEIAVVKIDTPEVKIDTPVVDPGPKVDPRYVVVPEEYNSENNSYTLPKTVPVDKKTGKPYAAGSDVYNEFTKADKIAQAADGRKVYWDGDELKAFKEAVIEPQIDPRYVVVPAEYNSKDNSYTLPKTVPVDKKTGKPYAAGTDVFNEFSKADKIAQAADGRKVYWDGDELKAYKEPFVDPRFVVVPAEYNSEENAYKLPKTVPNDPKTGKPFAAGTPVFKAFEAAKAVAAKSSNGKVFWDNDVLAFVPDKTVAVAPEGQSFKVQVAAMKNLNTMKYEELTQGNLSDFQVKYEKIQDGITRVVVVPKAQNEDGTYGFKEKEEALKVLKIVLEETSFKTSFIGIYEGDVRLEGLIRLDNQR